MIDALIIIILIVLAFIIAVSVALNRLGIHPELYKSKQIYSDHVEKVAKPFFSKEHLLVGKPDSILHTKEGLVPVEVKSSNRPKQPYFSHVMQLISYCLLVEINKETQGNFANAKLSPSEVNHSLIYSQPKKGLIQYRDGEPFVVEYTDELKDNLLEILKEMRNYIKAKKAPVLENVNGNKCGVCKYNGKCVGVKKP